jgi:hypothetical protein
MHILEFCFGLLVTILVVLYLASLGTRAKENSVAKHEARCAKLLRRCREDGLTRFECEVHLKQWRCFVEGEDE